MWTTCVSRTNARGFTLVELLVVLAVIALLAAILFPVFAKAREAAERTRCIAQVKQLAAAALMYAANYDHRLPRWYFGTASHSYTWDDAIEPLISDRALLVCPSADLTEDRPRSYGLNLLLDGRSLSHVRRPAGTVLLGERYPGSHIDAFLVPPSYDDPATPDNRPEPRHQDAAVFGFADGHAKPLAPEATEHPENLWDLR